jgi:DNA-directed RNA polymerase subunit RPC12/RpoP
MQGDTNCPTCRNTGRVLLRRGRIVGVPVRRPGGLWNRDKDSIACPECASRARVLAALGESAPADGQAKGGGA